MEEYTRQHRRAKVSWPVTINTEEGIIERITYNISPNGAFIRGLSPLELHEVVDMIVGGPDRSITVKARVVWSNGQIPPEKDMPRGMGVSSSRFLMKTENSSSLSVRVMILPFAWNPLPRMKTRGQRPCSRSS